MSGKPCSRDEADPDAATQCARAERWAELYPVKPKCIRPPFTPEIVEDAIRYFRSNHRPLLRYGYSDDEYVEVFVAEDCGDCYLLYDGDRAYCEPTPQTWRENLEREAGLTPEKFVAVHGFREKDLDTPIPRKYLVKRVHRDNLARQSTYRESPYNSAYLALVLDWPCGAMLPFGRLDVVGNPPAYRVRPKAALTFVQALFDEYHAGVKIVLEGTGGVSKEEPAEIEGTTNDRPRDT